MITIYAPDATDFSTLGLGALAPYECTVEEQAGGMYELTMTHPMDAEGKWLNIGVGCIVKAPAPVRETPLVESEIVGEGEATEPVTVTRKIYKVQTNTGANLHLRQGPSTSTAILSKYRPGTEVVVLSQANGWGQVIVCSSGATGYMSMQYLVYVRDETETIEGDAPGPERVVYPVQSRMQLFRIFKVERDAAEREVRVEARHIFYDLLGNVVKNEYAPEGEAADVVVEELFARALNPHDFSVHCQTARSVTGEYTRRGLVECLLDPDDGVSPQTGARLVRDNFDVWLLPDATRETGVTIRHGKNLLGATLTTDWDSLVTRIIPVGQDSEGKPLLLSGTIYVDSPHIDDYPTICAQAIEYDVKVGQEGIDNAAQARTKLTELAQADFSDNGVDMPTVGLDVDFVVLGETEEYRQYADLQAVHLYDTVRVIAKSAGIDATVRVTGYKWDALGRKYESVTLGEIADLKTTVYGYQLSNKSVGMVKLQNGAVGSAQLRELAVQYAHIGTAAVEQLSANSITALKAYIAEIVAGNITTDELYAGIASIAVAQITTANIESANIDWAQIGTLAADVAEIAKAHLGDADIDWASIQNLTAAVAEIADAKIEDATIGTAQIEGLNALVAQILHAEVEVGDFTLAEVQNLLANALILQQGQAGSMMITNLAVTSANMLNATIQTLIMPGEDGKYYQITVGTDGVLHTEEVTVTEDEIAAGQTDDGRQIVATTINAGSINGSTITAQEAILNTILTSALTAGKITAGEALIASATIPTLYVTSVEALGNSMTFSANEKIQSIVGDVQAAQGAADAAQSEAEFAKPYISDTPPEDAPEAGKMWVDTGVSPEVWRRWRGADVPTGREYQETHVGRGKNLLQIPPALAPATGASAVDVSDGGYTVSVTGSGAYAQAAIIYANVIPGREYTISAAGISGGNGPYVTVQKPDRTGIAQINATTLQAAFVPDDSRVIVIFVANGGNAALESPTTATFSGVMIEAGDTATAYEPYQDVPFLALDNGAGQMQRVAVEAGCRAKQAGTGAASPANVRAITGREGVEVRACGKNLFDYLTEPVRDNNSATHTVNDGVISVTPGGEYASGIFYSIRALREQLLGQTVTLSFEIRADASFSVHGMGLGSDMWNVDAGTEWQRVTKTSVAALTMYNELSFYQHIAGTPATFYIRNIQIERGSTATEYEPYRDMGGGEITPPAPLYGLPGAEDTVEVSVDGDVLVTRRTAVMEFDGTEDWAQVWGAGTARAPLSPAPVRPGYTETIQTAVCSHYAAASQEQIYTAGTTNGFCIFYDSNYISIRDPQNAQTIDGWKAYLAAQAEAGAPVTVVYELAAPETEALTAVTPIIPAKGQVNILANADALSASIAGSGWETVNDTTDMRMALADVDTDLAALTTELGLLDGRVGQVAEQIITSDEIKSIVVEMDEIKGMSTVISQQSDQINLVRVEIQDVDGRVQKIEAGVSVEGDNVTLYSSDSPYELALNSGGIELSKDGQAMITARENEVGAPRFRVTEALRFGDGMAFQVSDSGLRLLKM